MARTTVINIKTRGSYDVYIGRSTNPGKRGQFGNPCVIGACCPQCGEHHEDGASTLPCYTAYFYDRLNKDLDFKLAILELEGKVLGCFCKPAPCHGDVIIAYLESL